jgi:two-component system chemotaxis response regulator CheY
MFYQPRGAAFSRAERGIFMKVLLVDDNVLTREMIKDLLTEMGHEVVGEAGDGDEAVKMFAEKKPELVLMDLIMPGKSGLDALKEIKATDAAAKVVMVTAVQQDPISQQLMESGATGILHKPFMYGELEAVLKQIA